MCFRLPLTLLIKQHIHYIYRYTYSYVYVYELPSVDGSWDSKVNNAVQDPKGYATVCHKHSQYFFLLPITVR